MIFLSICNSYKNTPIYLKGVENDEKNIITYGTYLQNYKDIKHINISSSYYPETICRLLELNDLHLVWMCGHGILRETVDNDVARKKYNVFITDYGELTSDHVEMAVRQSSSQFTVYVFDFCHSLSMLNLKYFYSKGSFFKKIYDDEEEKTLYEDDDKYTRISIVGASDYDIAMETIQGGYLTSYLFYLLKTYGCVTLENFDENLPEHLSKSFICSNKILNPKTILLNT